MRIRRDRPAARIAAALGSCLTLAGLAGGLPAALYAIGGSPVPRAIPSWHQVIVSLGRPDNGSLALAAVRWTTWLAWAVFAGSVAAEACCQARGRSMARLPVLSPVQGLAAGLVSAVVLGLAAGPQLSYGSAALAVPARAVAPAPVLAGRLAQPATSLAGSQDAGRVWPARDMPGRPPARPAPARRAIPAAGQDSVAAPVPRRRAAPPFPPRQDRAAAVTGRARLARAGADPAWPGTAGQADCRAGVPAYWLYTVREGDNLWDIAASHLGNGEYWERIWDLNRYRPQPGGGELTTPGLIQPGWILHLPGQPGSRDATDRSPAAKTAHQPPESRPQASPHPARPAPQATTRRSASTRTRSRTRAAPGPARRSACLRAAWPGPRLRRPSPPPSPWPPFSAAAATGPPAPWPPGSTLPSRRCPRPSRPCATRTLQPPLQPPATTIRTPRCPALGTALRRCPPPYRQALYPDRRRLPAACRPASGTTGSWPPT
jgi:LysM domain